VPIIIDLTEQVDLSIYYIWSLQMLIEMIDLVFHKIHHVAQNNFAIHLDIVIIQKNNISVFVKEVC
jgi:hypothetical protein